LTSLDDALERARQAARRAGPGPPPGEEAAALEAAIAPGRPSDERLQEWAVIAVDPMLLRSNRRLGAPVTLAKRTLLRLLRQYTTELESQQTRFNLALLARLRELERRSGPE
jgi:hypothetical protein